jgi:hypothetical protein
MFLAVFVFGGLRRFSSPFEPRASLKQQKSPVLRPGFLAGV